MEKEKTNVDYSREMAIKDNYLEREFKRKILYDTDDQLCCFLFVGSQGCSKTSTLLGILDIMCAKKCKYFWLSDINQADEKVDKFFKNKDIQYFD